MKTIEINRRWFWAFRIAATTLTFLGYAPGVGAETAKPVLDGATGTLIPSYASRQTYTGQAYYRDENIWIYTAEFARLFRMPEQWISSELYGIEAAAFRLQPGELQCGLAGRDDNCRRWDKCVTDVYVDEAKHPLPWSTDRTADWLPIWDSAGWLFRAEDGAPGVPDLPPGIRRPPPRSLVPWADKPSGKVAMYYEQSRSPKGSGGNYALLMAYKRRLVGSLTQLTFNYRCQFWNKMPYTPFRLELREDGMDTRVLKHYHEFRLPASFEERISARLAEKNRRDETQYKQLLNVK